MCGSVRARVRRLPISLVLSLSSECINMRLHCYCVVKYIQLDNSWRIFSTSILSLFLVSFHCFSSQSFCDRNSKISETFSMITQWHVAIMVFVETSSVVVLFLNQKIGQAISSEPMTVCAWPWVLPSYSLVFWCYPKSICFSGPEHKLF